jgi:hypothetical protein
MHPHFEFFAKGVEVRWDHNSNQTKQTIPFAQILTVRLDYSFDSKEWSLFLLLRDSIKYTFTLKSCSDPTAIYQRFQEALLQ